MTIQDDANGCLYMTCADGFCLRNTTVVCVAAKGGMKRGAIAGAVVGAAAGVVALAIAAAIIGKRE